MNFQQRPTEILEDKSQKPELTVDVNQSRLFDDEDKDKDEDEDDNGANCLKLLKKSMSPQTLRRNDDKILVEKIPSKGSFSLCDPKSYPSGSVVNQNPTNEISGFAGKEESK